MDFFLYNSKKCSTFAVKIGKIAKMDASSELFGTLIERINKFGVWLDTEMHAVRPKVIGAEFTSPCFFFFLVRNGFLRVRYDLKEIVISPQQMACIMPGHLLQVIEVSEDLVFSRLSVSADFYMEMRMHAFSHDAEKFHYQPLYTLEDWQLKRLKSIGEVFAAILNHSETDLPLQRKMLLAQTAVAYEFINYYRREQDKQWDKDRHRLLFTQFCDKVVIHFREAKEIQFYADKLNVHPKQLNKIVREVTHGLSPKEWIEQYVATQAKRLIEAKPKMPLKQTAYALGFSEPSSFYRYFKRVTGMTAKEYRAKNENLS